ncbi:hypothetical protein MMPV_006445 [Pyropia vietnamensis]
MHSSTPPLRSAAARAAARSAASARTAAPPPWRPAFVARCLSRVKASRAAAVDARRRAGGVGGGGVEGAAVAAALAAAPGDGDDRLALPRSVSMLSPTVWSPPSSPICSPVKGVPPRQGDVVAAVPFGCASRSEGNTRWAATVASADRCRSPTPPAPPPVTPLTITAGAVHGFGGSLPRGALGAAASPHAVGVREQVVAAAASEGWVDLDGDELEGVLAEVEAALADEAAAEEAARVDAYLFGVAAAERRAAAVHAATIDTMDTVQATDTVTISLATTACAGEPADADRGSDADLDELIAWQARMTLGDGGGASTVADPATVQDDALCPVLCPVCEAGVLLPWSVGRGVSCAAGCGVHAPVGVDDGGSSACGVERGALATARCRLADALAAHADGGCRERLLGPFHVTVDAAAVDVEKLIILSKGLTVASATEVKVLGTVVQTLVNQTRDARVEVVRPLWSGRQELE